MTGEGRDRRAERAARREARWTRPRQPRDWRFWIGGLGRVLIVLGLLMFGFVGYQLWGTGLEYSQAQSRLDTELDELLAHSAGADASATTGATGSVTAATTVPGSLTPGSTVPGSAAPTTTPPTTVAPPAAMPAIAEGDAFARIEIPTIDVNAVVVAGVAPGDLKQGPGHYPGTPMPGQLGNSAIAGHRTTYGQPFFRLDEMRPGEQIVLTTVQGRFVYEMTSAEVVPPNRGDVVLTKDPTLATLTLTTCDPKWTATNRLIVYATLVPDAVPLPPDLSYGPGTAVDTTVATTTPPSTAAPGATTGADPTAGAATVTTGTDAPLPGDGAPSAAGGAEDPTVAADPGSPAGAVEDAFAHGWFSDTDAIPQVVLWGLVVAAIAIAGYLVARAFRRTWVGVLVAVAPFLIALYFFYQNVNRLLPAAL